VRWLIAIGLLSGCRQIFGIGSTELGDAAVVFDDAILDAAPCAGTALGAGLVHLCIQSFLPDRAITTPINTDTDCTFTVDGPVELCVISAASLTVSGTVVVDGPRPLVLAAQGDVSIAGVLDASGDNVLLGAGANDPTCVVKSGRSDKGGAGGGAGGSFGGKGGNGGTGDTNDSALPDGPAPGGVAQAAIPTPSYVRGGCPGGSGGANSDIGTLGGGGLGGNGGGAVYVIAGTSITVASNGAIYAAGQGGGASTPETGGGGAGAGGLIGLDAPVINVQSNAILAANGGGGGGGENSNGSSARAGQNGSTNPPTSNAVHGIGDNGADGGDGSCYATPDGHDGSSTDTGGGGGGGGVGFVWVIGNYMVAGGAKISPNAQVH
jgi:hypothetical protein